jgi:hypothetical protein
MNAMLKSAEFTPETRLSARDDLARVPLIAPQLMIIEMAGHLDLPRRTYWGERAEPLPANRQEPAADEPRISGVRRLLGAIGQRLFPRPRLPRLSEHLCRDIGIDWTPEPPVRTWPW